MFFILCKITTAEIHKKALLVYLLHLISRSKGGHALKGGEVERSSDYTVEQQGNLFVTDQYFISFPASDIPLWLKSYPIGLYKTQIIEYNYK